MKSVQGRVVVVLAAVLVLGCLGRSAAVRFYTMSPVEGHALDSIAEDLIVVVGPVSFPRYLERPHLVTRAVASELKIDEFRRWAGGFESNVRRVLVDNLRARLGQQRVATVPLVHPSGPVFRVMLDILQFEGDPGNDLILRVHWIAWDEAKRTRAWSEEVTIRRPLKAKDVASLVATHDQALGQLSDVIAARIASLNDAKTEAAPVGGT